MTDGFERFKFTGKEICALMRSHRVTIKTLAKRMQFPQHHIRKVRESGVAGHPACDWFEAITGALSPEMQRAYQQRSGLRYQPMFAP